MWAVLASTGARVFLAVLLNYLVILVQALNNRIELMKVVWAALPHLEWHAFVIRFQN